MATLTGAACSAILFKEANPTAGWMMAPYVAWLVYACYLNIGTAMLNNNQPEHLPFPNPSSERIPRKTQ